MPHLIVSTVALLSNLYKNAPLIVGDKDSDPDLMRFLGARITTNYPACGSPPMYVMHAPPRTVFDNLEKRGYCLMSAQTIQEHSVWILARPRVPDDDKVEISRGGPNDKSIQAFEDPEGSSGPPPTRSPSASRNRSPNKNLLSVNLPRSPSKQTLNDGRNKTNSDQEYHAVMQGDAANQKPLVGDEALYIQDHTQQQNSSQILISMESTHQSKFLLQVDEEGDHKKEESPSKPKSQLLGSQVIEIPKGEIQSEVGKLISNIVSQLYDSEVEKDSPPQHSLEKEKQSVHDSLVCYRSHQLDNYACVCSHGPPTQPGNQKQQIKSNSVTLTVHFPETSPRQKSSHKTKKAGDNQVSLQVVESEPKRRSCHRGRKAMQNNMALSLEVKDKPPINKNRVIKESSSLEIETTTTPFMFSEERHNNKQEDSQCALSHNKKDAGNVSSRGDAGTCCSGCEKVHMGIQASASEVSLKKSSDIMSRVAFNARNHSELLKNSDEQFYDPSKQETSKGKSLLKRTLGTSKEIQASASCETLAKPPKATTSIHFANLEEGLDTDKRSQSAPPFILMPRVVNFNDWPDVTACPYDTRSEPDPLRLKIDIKEESASMKEARILKDSVFLASHASRCSHIAIVGDADNPVFIDITDPNNLTCLTQESCCCEDN